MPHNILKAGLLSLIFTLSVCEGVAQQSRSSIRGRVVYADTGRPLRGASIVVMPSLPRSIDDEVITNRRGEFVITNVEAGTYLLGVEALGIISWSDYFFRPGVPMNDIPADQGRELFTEVSVNGTTNVEVEIKARRGGVITGRIVAEDEQPLAGADIQLLRRVNGDLIPVRSTWEKSNDKRPRTDSRGHYRIAGLMTGDYIVRVAEASLGSDRNPVDAGTYDDGSFMVAYYPDATTLKNAQSVAVVEGSETTGIDMRMPERAAHTISGTVTVGPENEVGAFVEIRLDRLDEKRPATHSILDVTTRSDEDGKWQINGLPDGDYQIVVGGDVRVGPPETGRDTSVVTTRLTTRVAGSDVALNIKLSLGAIVAGTIVTDSTDAIENSFLNLTLTRADDQVRPKSGAAGGAIVWNSREESTSMYVRRLAFGSSGFTAGRYWLSVNGLDPDRGYVKSVVRNNVDLMRTPLVIAENEDYRGIKVTLGSDMATVQGRVVQAADSKQELLVLLVSLDPVMQRFSEVARTVKPEPDGSFKIKLGPGEYSFGALTQPQIARLPIMDQQALIKLIGPSGQRIKVRAGENVKDLKVPPKNDKQSNP
jgi:hypothetical protein